MKNIDVIQQHVDQIKTDLDVLKKEANDFKSQKEKISAEEKKQKELLMNQKKEAIEIKKKEVEKMLIDIKLEQLDQAQLQKVVETEEEMNKIAIELEGLKQKNWLKRQRDGLSDATEEHHILKNTARIVGGAAAAYLAYRGIKKLFGRGKKKEKKEGEGDKDNTPTEKKPRYTRRWGIGAIGAGGILAWKNRDKISGWVGGIFGKEKEKKPETIETADGYENLSEEIKSKYRASSDSIDQYATTNNGFSVDFDKEKKSAILFGLDKETKNLAEFSTNDTLDYMQDQTEDGILDKIYNRGKTKIYNCLGPILSSFESFKPFGARFVSDPSSTLKEWLKQATPEEREKAISLFYKEYINIINYVEDRKKLLAEKLAKEEVMGKEYLNTTPTEEQQEKIDDLLESDDWKEKKLKPFFTAYKLADLADLNIQYNIDTTEISQETKKTRASVEADYDKMVKKEEDGSTAITRAEDDFQDEKIDKDTKDELIDVCEGFLEDGFGEDSRSFLGAYTHLITEIFAGNTEMEKSFLDKTQNKELIEEIKKTLTGYIQKLKAGTFAREDLQNLKQQIESYHKVKGQYEESIDKINGMSKGLHFSFEKVLNLPINAMRDLGKAFGIGKTNSWRERIGYGLGGAYIAGQTLYITSRVVGVAKEGSLIAKVATPILENAGKLGIKIGKMPVTLAHEGLKLYTGRTFLTSAGWSKYLISEASHLSVVEKEALLKHAFLRGEISEYGLMRVAKKLNISGSNGNLQSLEGILQKRGLKDIEEVKLFQKYRKNKDLAKLLFTETKNTNLGIVQKLKYNIYDKMLKFETNFNSEAFAKLKNIDERIAGFSTDTEKKIFQSMMSHVKNIDQAEDLVTMSIDAKYIKYFTSGNDQIISAEKFGKYLGKYGKNVNANNMPKLLEFFKNAKVANKMTAANQETIVFNAIKNFSKLDAKGFNITAIDELQLNTSRFEKIANKVKTGVSSMIKDLNEMLKNPKMKTFRPGIQSKINNLTEYAKTVTPESIKASQDASFLDKITGFGKLSDEGIAALKSLNTLIQSDKALLETLSKANKLEDIKSILKQSGIAADQIDDGVLLQIAKAKNVDKIKSIVNYGAEIKTINTIKKIFTNPGMKVFVKRLGVVGALVDFAFVGMDFVADMKEAEQIQQYNMARGKNKESEAYFDVVVGSTGAVAGLIGAVAIFGTANAWNPVGRVCLAGAGIAVGVEALGDLYYGEIDKFKQNYKDFVAQSMPEVKQRLIYINSWQNELEPSFQDFRSKVTGNMGAEEKKNLSPKTSADAVKALIYLEELQKYPYASADLNAAEVRNNPNLKALVEEQKSLHDKAVEIRYTYIKKNYIDGKSSIVSKDVIEKNQGISVLDNILAESRMCQAVENDATYTNKTDVKGYQKYLESDLKKTNAEGFAKLEQMYVMNKVQFFQTITNLPYYENILQGVDIADKDKLIANLAFFKKYANYKLANVATSDYPASPKVDITKNTIDYDAMTTLFASWKMTATGLTAAEVTTKHIEYLTDAQVIEKYNVSPNLGQNILYEIANKKLGYIEKNTLDELKKFYNEQDKAVKGIYFDPSDQDWAINENNGSDNEFATDAELNSKESIIKMRGYIYDAAESSSTGNMVAGNDTANKEYAKNYVDIINQNLDYRINPATYYTYIANYIKTNAHNSYIQLPPDILIVGIKAGIPNIGAFVYRRDGKNIEAKSGIQGIRSVFVPVK